MMKFTHPFTVEGLQPCGIDTSEATVAFPHILMKIIEFHGWQVE